MVLIKRLSKLNCPFRIGKSKPTNIVCLSDIDINVNDIIKLFNDSILELGINEETSENFIVFEKIYDALKFYNYYIDIYKEESKIFWGIEIVLEKSLNKKKEDYITVCSDKLTHKDIISLEEKYVYDVYDRISCHFSHTRHTPWPNVSSFLKNLDSGSIVLDVGCGNGKYANCNPNVIWIGTDRCGKLLECTSQQRGLKQSVETFVTDCTNLPIRSNSIDACICIAVIHHFPTRERRLQALREIVRCLKIDGLFLLYVWALEQQDDSIGARKFNQQDIMVPWHLQSNLDYKNENLTLYRYYHVFEKHEVSELCSEIKDLDILNIYYDANNWSVKAKKKSI